MEIRNHILRTTLTALGLLFLLVLPVSAQTTAVSILEIELWPDYDQPNVLVLVTGMLDEGTALPATLTIPLPDGATLNAVARITDDGVMTDDVQYDDSDPTAVTFTTPDARFRIEFYLPYQANGSAHQFSYSWQANFSVEQLAISVQQPLSASTVNITPDTSSIVGEVDGLTYHRLQPQTIAANESLTVNVEYEMESPLLTAVQRQNNPNTSPPATTPPVATTVPTNWPLYLAAVGFALIAIAMFWQVYSQRQTKQAKARPKPRSKSKSAKANFCHSCGTPTTKRDRFCRNCGVELKSI